MNGMRNAGARVLAQGKSLGPYPAGIGSLVIIVRQAFAFGTRFKCPVIASPPRTRSFNLWVAASALANKLQYCFAPTFQLVVALHIRR
jgi:hypothetical protein